MLSTSAIKEKLRFSSEKWMLISVCRALLISSLILYVFFILFFKNSNCSNPSEIQTPLPIQSNPLNSPTNLTHIVFGLLGSEKAWHYRKTYVQSWWRPGRTRGYLYLDTAPTGDLLPWSPASPPYRVSDNISTLLEETKAVAPVMIRMVHGIMEVFREEQGDMRWLVMGDDDSIFMVDNIVDVLSKYDHTKYYYFGGQSEFVLSNFWFSFNQGFGGAGFMMSYPLAKALSKDMEGCLRRYAGLRSADLITMVCIADVGVNLSPQKGIHQIDLRGDISGFLSSHPQAPLISLHHFDKVEPIFPNKNRFQSAQHLMKAATFDQSRMLQQTICYQRNSSWSFSIAWGYSVHIYEKIMPRSHLQKPIETFKPWSQNSVEPRYMFNTRRNSSDPCEAPHVFYFESIKKTSDGDVVVVYSRASARGLPACSSGGGRSADYISRIEVLSPASKRIETGRCECCDVIRVGTKSTKLKYRQCSLDEIIA